VSSQPAEQHNGRNEAKPSLLQRIRRRPGIAHLVRAAGRYQDRYGDHYAAAITYFSVLALVPLLMIAFAAAGFVLVNQPELLARLQNAITDAVPGELGDTLNEVVNTAIEQRGAIGLVGLLGALYSGLGWMSNLRDALTAQWDRERPQVPFLRRMVVDLIALVGLGLAIVVSFGLTAVGTAFSGLLLRLIGLEDAGWAQLLVRIGILLLSLAANWLVFLWVLSRLPRERVSARSAMRGALLAAVGFELFKQLGSIYLRTVTGSPSGAAFGSLLGLLVFIYLVSRFLLFVTAWTATAPENLREQPVPPPPPAVIRPVVQMRSGPDGRTAATLVGAGALAGAALRGLLRRR